MTQLSTPHGELETEEILNEIFGPQGLSTPHGELETRGWNFLRIGVYQDQLSTPHGELETRQSG